MQLNELIQLRADSTTLFLAYQCNANRGLSTAVRAKRVRNCAKILYKRTSDIAFKQALQTIRKHKDNTQVLIAVEKAVSNYFKGVRA